MSGILNLTDKELMIIIRIKFINVTAIIKKITAATLVGGISAVNHNHLSPYKNINKS
jgi:hypothetical protein